MTTPSNENESPGDGKTGPWDEPKQQPAPLGSDRAPTPLWRRYLALAGLGVAMLFIAGWGILELTHAVSNQKRYADTGSQDGAGRSELEANADFQSAAVAERQPPPNVISTRDAVQRSTVLKAQADVQAAQDLLTRLLAQQARWRELVPPLLENEVGRRIAADSGAVKFFAVAQDRERLTPRVAEGIRQSLLAIATPVEAAAADETAVLDLDPAFTRQLDGLTQQLESGLRQWQEDNALVRLLVSEAEQRAPAEATLAEALEMIRAAELRERAEKIAADVEAAKAALAAEESESQMRLQELESRNRLAADEVEAKRREAELANLSAEKLALADQIAAQRAMAELERKFQADLPEIRKTLVPYITPGHKQIVDGKWTYVEEPVPMSLSGLKSFGVFSNDRVLYVTGGHHFNDRPNGPFRDHSGAALYDSDMPLVLKTRRLLETYGDLMVKKGMLAP